MPSFSSFFRNKVKAKQLFPDRRISVSKSKRIKNEIRLRLSTEDYTCRIPRPKARIRYKLRMCIDASTWSLVWK